MLDEDGFYWLYSVNDNNGDESIFIDLLKRMSSPRNIVTVESAKKQRSIEKALARELMLASEINPDSYAISKKEETERQAESAHN